MPVFNCKIEIHSDSRISSELTLRIRPLLRAIYGLIAMGACAHAFAANSDRIVTDPTLAIVQRPESVPLLDRALLAHSATATGTTNGEASLTLDVGYTVSEIYNPATQKTDRVRLRSYHSPGTDPDVPFVAPTIDIAPGETVRMTLNNQLGREPGCTPANINTPHCFNSTNMHAHGLWVSPSGNSDNVLITLRPGVSFQYEYNIPADHPSGTYWYHPHLHGSTALQVSSGMAGALIVRGSRLPQPDRTGDIDTLLRQANGTPIRERVVLLQQVQYACRDQDGNIKVKKDSAGKVIEWVCDPDDVGGIEKYDQFGSTWVPSNRYTSINGRILPTFGDARTGEIERWRLIHAGIRNTIALQFRKLRDGAPSFDALLVEQQEAWVKRNCTGPVLPQAEIATDGLTHGQIIPKNQNMLQPGYRSDVLMVFPEAGDYCVIDTAAPANATVGNTAESRQVLGQIRVQPGVAVPGGNIPRFLTEQLELAADRFMPVNMKAKVKSDLGNGLKLSAFMPHPDITDAEVTGTQQLTFNIANSQFTVDDKPYDPTSSRTLVLGNVDEWTLTSKVGGHPFHIHVNPFQVVKILDPTGKDVSESGEANDSQYAQLKGTWKDTLFVKQGYKVVVRTRYQRYIGDYVLHCHILDHEDQGMMQNVRVLLPDGEGGVISGHH